MDLEQKLKILETNDEFFRDLSKTLIKRSHALFQMAENETNAFKRFYYTFKASWIQYFAFKSQSKSFKYFDSYWKIRRSLKSQIEENARILGYKAKLQSY